MSVPSIAFTSRDLGPTFRLVRGASFPLSHLCRASEVAATAVPESAILAGFELDNGLRAPIQFFEEQAILMPKDAWNPHRANKIGTRVASPETSDVRSSFTHEL